MNTSLRRLLLTVVSTPAVALAVWALAVPLAGADLTVRMDGGTQTVGPVLVAVVSILAGLAGWGLLAALERRAARPARTWRIIALAVLAASLLGPLGSAVGAAATLVLLLLHLVVGGVLVIWLVRR